jgi:hypothetical protein
MPGVTMSPLTFCRDTKRILATTADTRFVASLHLTNSVLHCTTKSLHPQYTRARERFWSHAFDDSAVNEKLATFSNDSYGGPNYRVDTLNGRVLSFCAAGNHIRAGPASPCSAINSMYEYHRYLLNTQTTLSYPTRIVVPNTVGTGYFRADVRADIDTCALVSSTAKFPGRSVSLSTKSTPMIYLNKGKKKGKKRKSGRTFILPGMTTALQAAKSVVELESIVRPESGQGSSDGSAA